MPDHPTHGLTVVIIYNGLDRPVSAEPNQAVQALLELAMNAFGVHQNRHLMALWTEAGVELQLNQSVQQAGIVDGTRVLLRPSAVRGGTNEQP